MRKIFLAATMLFTMCIVQSFGQLTVNFASANDVEPGTNTTIDVTVNGFQNILGAQFSINYDSLVLEYVNATNFATLSGLNVQSVSGPNGVGVKKGQMTFSWFSADGNGKTLANGTRLFSIVFKATGPKCSSSDVIASSTPRIIEISNGNLDPVPFLFNKGTVKLKCGPVVGGDPCPDPACTNANNLTITGGKVNAQPGETVCVPFTVSNFKDIQSGQGSFTWNPTELQYVEHKVPDTGGLQKDGWSFNAMNTTTGQLGFVWTNQTPGTPVTLPNGTKIIDLCFKVLAPAPDTVCVLYGQGTLTTEWANNSGEVATCIKYGKVILGGPPPPANVTIKVNSVTNATKDQIVCVDVTVSKFTDISSLMTRFEWNAAELEFVRTDMYSLDALTTSNFNNGPNFLNLSWSSAVGVTKADGAKIFQICFKVLGPCPGVFNIRFAGNTEVSKLVNGNPTGVTATTEGGSISCVGMDMDPPVVTCTQGIVVNPTCNGRTDGSANVTVSSTLPNECVIEWKILPSGTVVKPAAAITAGTNITGRGAGTYMYEVRWTKDNRVLCSGMITITEPLPISVPTNNFTNANCGNKGSIDVGGTTGGTTPYTYTWTPTLPNTSNPTNLDPSQYTVVVTDRNGCVGTASFTITNVVTELVVSLSATNVKCNGNTDGIITVNASGGCAPYTTAGALTGLKAGTYTITVTDAAGTTKSASTTITEPSPIVIGTPLIVKPTSAGNNNGTITINISGGTAPYTVSPNGGLAGGSTSGSFTTNSVPAGTYAITVTDANGCTSIVSNIVVMDGPVNVTKPEITSAVAPTPNNGFSVLCNGDATGTIVVQLTGTTPITAQLISNGQSVGSAQTITQAGAYTFTGLKAGTYTFTLTNPAGTVTSSPIEVKQPTKLAVSNAITCTDEGKTTGSVKLDAGTTGVGPYTYSWSTGATTADLSAIGRGLYNVTVTDKNGCTQVLNNLEVKNCETGGEPGDPCYIANKVITPNGDNLNDRFVISCVQNVPGDLAVYDRWGKLVYNQIDYDNTWSGVSETGADLKEGGYIWVLTNRLGQGRSEVYKGVVTILR